MKMFVICDLLVCPRVYSPLAACASVWPTLMLDVSHCSNRAGESNSTLLLRATQSHRCSCQGRNTTMRPAVLLLSLISRWRMSCVGGHQLQGCISALREPQWRKYFSHVHCKLSSLGQAEIVRGHGFAAPPPGHFVEAETGLGARPPRHSRPAGHQERRRRPVKVLTGMICNPWSSTSIFRSSQSLMLLTASSQWSISTTKISTSRQQSSPSCLALH